MKPRKIDFILNYKVTIRGICFQMVDILFIVCLMVISLFMRTAFLDIQSGDYLGFLQMWMQTIRERGGFASMGLEISNYTPAYMYILSFLSYFDYSDLHLIKFVSILFDYLAGIGVFLIVYHMTRSTRKAILGMSMLLLAPSVVINSAYWAQCDIIYTTFILYALYFILKGNSRKALIFVGIAFSFKQQTLFFLPFLILMWLKQYVVRLRDFIWIPLIYFITIIPPWLLGRDLNNLLSIYFSQSDYYPWGTLEYPNLYVLLGEAMPNLKYPDEFSSAGIWLTILLMGCLAYYFYGKKIALSYDMVITTALLSVTMVVYCLPHMHERYGFLIDLLAIIYGFLNIRRIPVMISFLFISLISYMPFLINMDIIPLEYSAFWLLGTIVYVGRDWYRQIQASTIIPESNPEAI